MPFPDPPSPREIQGTRTRGMPGGFRRFARPLTIGRARPAATNQETRGSQPRPGDCWATGRERSPASPDSPSTSPMQACAASSPVSPRVPHGECSGPSSCPASNPAAVRASKSRRSTLRSTGKNPCNFGNFWRFAAYQSTRPCQASPAGSSRRFSRFCLSPSDRRSLVGSRGPSRGPPAPYVRPKSHATCVQSAASGCDEPKRCRHLDGERRDRDTSQLLRTPLRSGHRAVTRNAVQGQSAAVRGPRSRARQRAPRSGRVRRRGPCFRAGRRT